MADDRPLDARLDDAELDQLIASLDPWNNIADGPLTAREEALLQGLSNRGGPSDHGKAVPRARTRRGSRRLRRPRDGAWSRRRRLLPVTLAAALVLIMGFVAVSLAKPQDAVATAPHPLGVASIDDTASQVVEEAIARLGSGPSEPVREAHFLWWKLGVFDDGLTAIDPTITPHQEWLRWEEDGSGHRILLSGEPYASDGSSVSADERGVPETGTVVLDERYLAGDGRLPMTGLPLGDSLEDVVVILRLPEDPNAADVFSGVVGALRVLTFSDAQERRILELLQSMPDVQVMGTATDRLGREVVILATETPEYRETLHLSVDTGRIVGAETIRLTRLGGAPAGAIQISFAWDLSGIADPPT